MARLVSIAACAMVCVGFLRSASAGPVAVGKVDVTAYEQLPDFQQNNERGVAVRTMKAPEGKVYVWVVARIDVAWDAKTTEVKFAKAGLFDGDKAIPSLGSFAFLGVPNDYASDPRLQRPWDWKPDKPAAPSVIQGVYLLPKDKKDYTLKFDDATAPVAVPAQNSTMDLSDLADVKIDDAQLSESVDFKTRDQARTITLANPGGKILTLRFTLTPKKGNVPDDPNRFVWMTDWMALDLGNGLRVASVGSMFMGGLTHLPHNPNRYDPQKPWPGDDCTLYFAAPPDLHDFTLTMLANPVAKGTAK